MGTAAQEKEMTEYFKKLGVGVFLALVILVCWIYAVAHMEKKYKGVLLVGFNMERTYYPDAIGIYQNPQNENEIGLKDAKGFMFKKLDKRDFKGYVEIGGANEFDDWIGTKVIFEHECVPGWKPPVKK